MGLFHTRLSEIVSLISKGERRDIDVAKEKLAEHFQSVNRGRYGTLIQNMQVQLAEYTSGISRAFSELNAGRNDICLKELEEAISRIERFKDILKTLIQEEMIKLE